MPKRRWYRRTISWLVAGALGSGGLAMGAAQPPPTPGRAPAPGARMPAVPSPNTGVGAASPAAGPDEGMLPPLEEGQGPPGGAGAASGRGAGAAPVEGMGAAISLVPQSRSILAPVVAPLDLNTALRLAGVQNPELMLARQRVLEAVAQRQFAAAQILPTLNGGMNYDNHTGALQQSSGNILSVNRSALYVGAGANAVAAGTVNIPGIFLTGNIAQGVYAFLVSRQVVREREFTTLAIRNQTFLQVTRAYSELIRAEGRRVIAGLVRDEARRVADIASGYAQAGQATEADAHRAATELARREAEFQAAEGRVLTASARLAEVLNVDPSVRLHPTDAWAVPQPIVPEPIPLPELIAIALLQRPELGERRAVIRQALLALEGSKVLPFSPTILIGFSSGGFGGGSNLVRPVFGGFGGRSDFDAISYWTIQNMGVGNVALINLASARLRIAQVQEIGIMNQIRAEVAEAQARIHARFAQIGSTEAAVRSARTGFREDLDRIEGAVGLPIEVLDSLRLLADARYEYLDAIIDYNEAQFALYVALGQPPANMLAHPAPTFSTTLVRPPGSPPGGPMRSGPTGPGAEPEANPLGGRATPPARPVTNAAAEPGRPTRVGR